MITFMYPLSKCFEQSFLPHYIFAYSFFPQKIVELQSLSAVCVRDLKVHKNENFFGFYFEFCTISLLVDWTIMGGATIISRSLKTKQNKKKFQVRPKFF
jgi:hypothetical protein